MGLGQRALLLLTQASEEAGHVPQELVYELVSTWSSEEEPMGDIWMFLLKLSCVCLEFRSRGLGLHLREVRTPLVFRGLDVHGRSPLQLFWGCSGHSACCSEPDLFILWQPF